MTMSGTLNGAMPPKTSVAGKKVYVDLETLYFDGSKLTRSNIGFSYTLNSKGSSAKSATGSIKFTAKFQPKGKATKESPEVDFKIVKDNANELLRFMNKYGDQPPTVRTKTVTTTTTFTIDGNVYRESNEGTATVTLDANGNPTGYSNNP